jgi:hypothetical protein
MRGGVDGKCLQLETHEKLARAGFNVVAEWIDHRKTRQNANQRLNSAWFGESSRIKAKAF